MEVNPDLEEQDKIIRPKPVFLLLLDGWGIAGKSEANAISLAKLPNILKLIKEYPAAPLKSLNSSINSRYFSLGLGREMLEDSDNSFYDLSAIISASGLKQLKIFDSERLAPLTYFFNGRREEKLLGEEWLTISSVNEEQVFDPFLALDRKIKASLKAVKSNEYDFIVAACPILDTLATNNDLMGVIKAAEIIDKAVRRLAAEILSLNGILIISSTHGNAEKIIEIGTDFPNKEITNNPVPVIIVAQEFKGKTIGFQDAPDGDLSILQTDGSLIDIAPTILDFFEIENKELMSGISLLIN